MIQKTSFASGKNEFKDFTFSAREWSAPTMTDPAEIKARLEALRLEGREIRHRYYNRSKGIVIFRNIVFHGGKHKRHFG